MPTLTKLYSMREVSQHNSKHDCWLLIHNKVYDVSSYLDDHPGGDEVLLAATGEDATEEFEDAGHSKTARELMENYCIGELDLTPAPIPEPEIIQKKQQNSLSEKVRDLTKEYWAIPVAAVGITVVVSFLYSRRN